MEMTLWCDESDFEGRYFSNFYGGSIVHQYNMDEVISKLEACKARLNLGREVKWQRVTDQYLPKYIELMNAFFELIKDDKIKMRVMFTKNANVPIGLTEDQVDNRYFILYYQFIKYGFGFTRYEGEPVNLRIFLDKLPDKNEKVAKFRRHIFNLNSNPEFYPSRIKINEDQIAEANSVDHVVLQCTDIVLGAMNFRLNDKHKEKPAGQTRRGRRTLAKLKLYAHMNKLIRGIYPGFNIGKTTGIVSLKDHWIHPYRHWEFIPKNHEVDKARHK
jgi:hypothetical protein